MQPKSPSRSEHDARPAPRKSYRKPKLHAYGDLTEVRKNINGSKTNDGTGHPNKHYTS